MSSKLKLLERQLEEAFESRIIADCLPFAAFAFVEDPEFLKQVLQLDLLGLVGGKVEFQHPVLRVDTSNDSLQPHVVLGGAAPRPNNHTHSHLGLGLPVS